MDYSKIYAAFIADRKRREAELSGYTEKHHIVPRCMGGGDEPSNLIKLTAEDHFFAHILLAKAHDTAQLWGAARLMVGHVLELSRTERKGLPRIDLLRRRRLYGAVRRWSNQRLSGLGHPMADTTAYHFVHTDGREYQGTRIEFSEAHEVPPASVNAIVVGACLTAYGWYLPSLNPEGKGGWEVSAEAQRDREKRNYRHFDGREVHADRREMAEIAGVTVGNIGMLITGKIKLSNGWQLIEDGRELVTEDHLRFDGEFNARYDATVYTFEHDSGETFTGTMGQASERFGNRPTWTAVAAGAKTYKGWRLQGANMRRSTKGKVHRFINRDGRAFEGTQHEFAKAMGIGDGAAFRVACKQGITVCGWRLEGTPDRHHFAPKVGGRPGLKGAVFRLTDGECAVEGDRQYFAHFFGVPPETVSTGLYGLRKGLVPTYKGFRLVA